MPWSFLADYWLAIALAAYFAWVLGATWTILQQRRAPAATLSWIFAFVALPFVSGLYYIVFGPRRLHRRRIRYGVARRSIATQIQEYIRSSASKVKPQLTADATAMAKVV
jgi:cardiolipin synthase A/B